MMKHSAILTALTGLGLALSGASSHAQGLVFNPISILPGFSATLNIASLDPINGGSVNINATDANTGGAYVAGLFGYDGTEFQVENLTANQEAISFPEPTVITPELSLSSLLLTENFATGPSQTVNLYDPSDSSYANPLNSVGPGLTDGYLFLQSAPLTLPSNLQSATLTGVYTDGATPAGQPIPVRVSAVPEPGTDALLLAGLALAVVPTLRARKARRA